MYERVSPDPAETLWFMAFTPNGRKMFLCVPTLIIFLLKFRSNILYKVPKLCEICLRTPFKDSKRQPPPDTHTMTPIWTFVWSRFCKAVSPWGDFRARVLEASRPIRRAISSCRSDIQEMVISGRPMAVTVNLYPHSLFVLSEWKRNCSCGPASNVTFCGSQENQQTCSKEMVNISLSYSVDTTEQSSMSYLWPLLCSNLHFVSNLPPSRICEF